MTARARSLAVLFCCLAGVAVFSLAVARLGQLDAPLGRATLAMRAAPATRPEGKYGWPSDDWVPRPGFSVRLNPRTRCPDWVLYKVDPRGNVDRKDFPWRNDPNVPAEQQQHAKAYHGAHWHADGVNHQTRDSRLEIGHYKPAANSKQSAEMMAACMVLDDNLAPQCAGLNEKTWRFLEAFVGTTAEVPKVGVLCAVGPLWYAEEGDTFTVQVLEDGTHVPTHFWKAVLIERQDGVELKAWILPNVPDPPADFDEGATTTDRAEQLAGVDLWRELPDELEDALEGKRP